MTDARISRTQAEALGPASPAARLSRATAEVLWTEIPTLSFNLSRAQVEVLERMVQQPALIARQHVEVLWSTEFAVWRMEAAGPKPIQVEAYDDGTGPQEIETLGWWDGATAQPLTPP